MDSIIVLSIDDRPQVLELRKAVLASHNFAVETALNGYTTIKMLEGRSADAVLVRGSYGSQAEKYWAALRYNLNDLARCYGIGPMGA